MTFIMSRFVFKSSKFPEKPGCYIMRNSKGRVIYAGKAKNLRQRLYSYFQPNPDTKKIERLISQVDDIEVIIVNNEQESLVLENNLIKLYRPRYNRALKNEKTGFFYIMLTGEEFPRFLMYRKKRLNKALQGLKEKNGEIRYGPYLKSRYRNTLLEFIIENFKIRICKPLPGKVCLRYHLGKCSGICERKVTPEEYMESVNRAVSFLSHKHDDMISHMKENMFEYSEKLEFEKAQKIRDQIEALENTLEPQIVEIDIRHNQDVVYFGESSAMVTKIECGMIQCLSLYDLELSCGYDSACRNFLISRYRASGNSQQLPLEIIVNRLNDPGTLETELSMAMGSEVKITLPLDGAKLELLKLCRQNYEYRISTCS